VDVTGTHLPASKRFADCSPYGDSSALCPILQELPPSVRKGAGVGGQLWPSSMLAPYRAQVRRLYGLPVGCQPVLDAWLMAEFGTTSCAGQLLPVDPTRSAERGGWWKHGMFRWV